METKITDLVDPSTIEQVKQLNTELKNLLESYKTTAKELAHGLDINVGNLNDVEKLEKQLAEKQKELAQTTAKLNIVLEERNKVVANTTNTISRELMVQERYNKTQRETYDEQSKVKQLIEQMHGSYQGQIQLLNDLDNSLKNVKKEQKDNEDAFKKGVISLEQYKKAQETLTIQQRQLTLEKRQLNQVITAEEKAMAAGEGSYVELSQQLELLKKSYKNLSDVALDSDIGKDLELTIQNLDAHLKDMAADMGEFQRNVGNYAIAGQNGIVSTESLTTALNREARTMQDLADQTKILEEAKVMLDKKDENYEKTIEDINAKLAENKRKLSDVSDIMGKQATTIGEAESQNKRLKEALNHVDLTAEDAQKRIKELNDKIAENTKLINDNTPAVEKNANANKGLADQMGGLLGINANFGSSLQSLSQSKASDVIEGLTGKCKAFGSTLMGLLSNPYLLAFLGIVGVFAAAKWWYSFNKGLVEASRLTRNFTDETGDAADKITADMQTIADSTGKGYRETISAANTLVQQFGVSWEEASTLMKDGIQAGADMNGAMLSNIERFAGAFRDAGVEADQFIAILAETRNGIFDERALRSIADAGSRLRAMSKSTQSSLDAIGISAKQMQDDLAAGNITMIEAVQMITDKLKTLPPNCQEVGEVMKNVFGRKSAMNGEEILKSISDINDNLDIAKEKMGSLGEANRKQMEAQERLNRALISVFKLSGTTFEEMNTEIKAFCNEALADMVEGFGEVVNWVIRMYNSSMYVRGWFQSFKNQWMLLWDTVKFVIARIVHGFRDAGKIIEDVFTLNWDKLVEDYANGWKSLWDDSVTFAKNIGEDFADAFNKTLNDHIDEINVGFIGVNGSSGGESEEETDYEEPEGSGLTPEQMKAQLKLLQDLEESKIAIMEEGHEKEIALIKLKYKKKLDTIQGEGLTEKALRINLMVACEKEIAAAEEKYQKNLMSINIQNRLATVKKGSEEEKNLRMAQLKAQWEQEVEAAEKTGADVNEINQKFMKQFEDLEHEYATKRAERIQEEYGIEAVSRNEAYRQSVVDLRERYLKEMEAAGSNSEKRKLLQEKLSEELTLMEENYAQEVTRATIEMLEKILENEELSYDDRLKWEKKLAEEKIKLAEQGTDATMRQNKKQSDDDKKLTDKRKANLQSWLQKAQEAINAISGLASTLFDGQIEKIEEQQEANEKAGEKEQERISNLVEQKVITEEEGEARKRAAEAKTAQKEEELEKKKQQLKYKQALWDKANSVAQVGISTALAIMNASHMEPWIPLGIASAAAAGALGAIQLATILATPIPKYAKGTDYHRGGPAMVGDGGKQELVLFNGGSWVTPDTPTLVDLPKGARVLPDIATVNNMLIEGADFLKSDTPKVIVNNDYRRLERGIDNLAQLIRMLTRLQQQIASHNEFTAYKREKL